MSSSYGDRYWRVGVVKDPFSPEKDEEDVYIFADNIEVTASGALVAWGGFRRDGEAACLEGERIIVCSFAPGQWFYFFAASMMDGSAVCAADDDDD